MIGRTPARISAVRPLAPRRDRRLRGHRADAAPLHGPRAVAAALGAPARDDLRAVGDHRRRAPRADRGLRRRRRALGPPDRGVARGRDRRRAADRRAARERRRRRRRRDHRGRGASRSAGIVVSRSLRVGGYDLDDAVAAWLRNNARPRDRRADVGAGEARGRRRRARREPTPREVKGRDPSSGLPRQVDVPSRGDARGARGARSGRSCSRSSRRSRTRHPSCPPTCRSAASSLAGGGVLLRGFAERLEHETKVPVRLADVAAHLRRPRRRPGARGDGRARARQPRRARYPRWRAVAPRGSCLAGPPLMRPICIRDTDLGRMHPDACRPPA